MASDDHQAAVELTFEQALGRLEQAVLRLESGDLSLEEAMQAYEEGLRMVRVCESRLERAEQRLMVLMERGGRPEAQPLRDAGENPA